MTVGPPLRANPGGQLAADEIVGRTELVDRLLDTLELRSVVLTGERRLGKTTLTTLLEQLAPDRGWSIVKVSVEGLKTSDELYGVLIREIDRVGRSGVGRSARAAKGAVEGVTVAGVQLKPSSPVLDEIIRAAVERLGGRLLLVLDELPILCERGYHVIRCGYRRASRAAAHPAGLRPADADARLDRLPPRIEGRDGRPQRRGQGAADRARCRPRDRARSAPAERLCGDDGLAVAAEIARLADCVPYYIHSIVEAAKRRPGRPPLAAHEVDALVEAQRIAGDAWNMRHFRDRIPLYYGDDASLAIAALDAIATRGDEGLDLDAVIAHLDLVAALAPVARAAVQQVLTTLADDHYVVADAAGVRTFAFPLVRRAWIATGR